MEEQKIKDNWPQFKFEIQKKWPKINDDELDRINGNLSILITTIQSKYFSIEEKTREDIENLFKITMT